MTSARPYALGARASGVYVPPGQKGNPLTSRDGPTRAWSRGAQGSSLVLGHVAVTPMDTDMRTHSSGRGVRLGEGSGILGGEEQQWLTCHNVRSRRSWRKDQALGSGRNRAFRPHTVTIHSASTTM